MKTIILMYAGNHKVYQVREIPRMGDKILTKGKMYNIKSIIHDMGTGDITIEITLLDL